MGDVMRENVTVVRHNDKLRATDTKLRELLERYNDINVLDDSSRVNQCLVFARELWNMLTLARAITLAALARDESRGAHYKPEFPKRDDENWLKTTKAFYTPEAPRFEYEPVDISLLEPRERHYELE
jgi:succinate dehydrogenase / fumarate reductase flavoprotein subunit